VSISPLDEDVTTSCREIGRDRFIICRYDNHVLHEFGPHASRPPGCLVIRILFADSDPDALAQLRQMLRGWRDRWSMAFVASSSDALDALTIEQYDVVVVDARMPGLDGHSLLAEVRERQPGAVRFVLAESALLSSVAGQLPVAHQFLSRPCDPSKLEAAIDRSLLLRDRLTSPELLELIVGLDALPTPSATVIALQAALAATPIDPDRISKLIRTDVAISAKVLQIANSALFGMPRTVTDPGEAVDYLGAQSVCDLVISAEIFRSVGARSKARDGEIARLQQRGMGRADMAFALAMCANRPGVSAREIWMAAFLAEVGALLLLSGVSARGASAVTAEVDAAQRHANLVPAIGAYLLSMWGLPYHLVEAVALSRDSPTMHGTDAAGFTWVASHLMADGQASEEISEEDLRWLDLTANDLAAVSVGLGASS
jgi:HD-like signal output (HDOD) protein